MPAAGNTLLSITAGKQASLDNLTYQAWSYRGCSMFLGVFSPPGVQLGLRRLSSESMRIVAFWPSPAATSAPAELFQAAAMSSWLAHSTMTTVEHTVTKGKADLNCQFCQALCAGRHLAE